MYNNFGGCSELITAGKASLMNLTPLVDFFQRFYLSDTLPKINYIYVSRRFLGKT